MPTVTVRRPKRCTTRQASAEATPMATAEGRATSAAPIGESPRPSWRNMVRTSEAASEEPNWAIAVAVPSAYGAERVSAGWISGCPPVRA